MFSSPFMALSRWKCWFLSWTMLALRKCYNSSNEDRFPQKRCWIRTSRSNQWRYKAKSNISLHQLVLFHSEVMTIDHNDGYGGISNHISNTTQYLISSLESPFIRWCIKVNIFPSMGICLIFYIATSAQQEDTNIAMCHCNGFIHSFALGEFMEPLVSY